MKIIVFAEETSWRTVHIGPGIMILGVYTLQRFKSYLDQVINDISKISDSTYTFYLLDLDENCNSIYDIESIWIETQQKRRISYWIDRDGNLTWHLHESPSDYEKITYTDVINLFNQLLSEEKYKLLTLKNKNDAAKKYLDYLENHLKYMPNSIGAREAQAHFINGTPLSQIKAHEKINTKQNGGQTILLLTSESEHAAGIDVLTHGTYTLNGFVQYLDYVRKEVENNNKWNHDHEYKVYVMKLDENLSDQAEIDYEQYHRTKKIRIIYEKDEDKNFKWYLWISWRERKEITYEQLIQIFRDLSVDENDPIVELKAELATSQKDIEHLENQVKSLPDGKLVLESKTDL